MTHPRKARYTVVTGDYWIHDPRDPKHGPRPDGHSISFRPHDPAMLQRLPRLSGTPPVIRDGSITLRHEGIATLETHFGGGRPRHQALHFAQAARGLHLASLGYTGVSFSAEWPGIVKTVDRDPLPGHVLANGIDASGRLVALAYTGRAAEPEGSTVYVDEQRLGRSINAEMVRAGLAYVEPYDSMPMALVRYLRSVVHQVRNDHHGLWPQEGVSIRHAARIRSLDELQALVMWPKLFRRLAAYFDEGHTGLSEFDAWIRQDRLRRDDALRLPDGELGHMHDTYLVEGDSLRLRFAPEDLLIAPDARTA